VELGRRARLAFEAIAVGEVPGQDRGIGELAGDELEVALAVRDLGVQPFADRSYSGQKFSCCSVFASSRRVENSSSSASASVSLCTE
jgi:hypothetical protein